MDRLNSTNVVRLDYTNSHDSPNTVQWLKTSTQSDGAIPTYTQMVDHWWNKLGSTLGINEVTVVNEKAPKRDLHKLQREAMTTYNYQLSTETIVSLGS